MPVAPTSAAPYLPEKHTLPVLREAVQACRGCDLYRNATQAVFGEIEADREAPKPHQHSAQVMLIGEQPGDREDLEGRPFVGPAGKLLDRALEQAGIPRARPMSPTPSSTSSGSPAASAASTKNPPCARSRPAAPGSTPRSKPSIPASSSASAPPPPSRS